MEKIITLTCCYLIAQSCFAQHESKGFKLDDDGILVERFDSLNTDENRYNLDNKIYTVGKKFIFSYYYQDQAGTKYLMTKEGINKDGGYEWKFDELKNNNPKSVFQIILSVNSGLSPFIQQIPDYNQTVITYNFKMLNGELWTNEMTGVIENEKNSWLHPPRTDFFKILELNPFPYIKAPYRVGTKWEWKLKFGSHWADKRWLMWEGPNENRYAYTITKESTILTKLGKLNCLLITSTAHSNLGQTKLTSYFNTVYGFVKLDYVNIDGSKTVLELEQVE